MVFRGIKFSVGKFDWKKNSVSEMDRNILLALCALKNIVFVRKKIMSRQIVAIFFSAALRSEKK